MQSKKLKKLISLFFVLFILSACTKDVIVPDPPAPPPPPPVPGEMSYSGVIQPIFTAKCIACHNVGQNAPVLTTGKSYISIMSMSGMVDTVSPGSSILYTEMATGGGMAMYCKKADADSVYKWISQGAKNN